MSYETITLEIDDATKVATITLNRPERLNAASLEMAQDLTQALGALGDARALLITGAGRAFCSGADLAARGERTGSPGYSTYLSLQNHYNPLMLKLARLTIPVVTAVNGPAAGIGCSIALAGDFTLAGKSGYFLQAFVNIGLVPDGGSSWTLPRLVGKARATQMMMLGEKIGGEKAESWGLIYKCVEDDELQAEARALAERLASMPTLALGMMRRTIAAGLDGDLASTLVLEAETQEIAGASEDAREGGLSFLEKRKPQFKGK